MKANTAIIIVNWNGKHFLKNCLEAVYRQNYKNFIVYFVDNGSEDGSVDFVLENFPQVKMIALEKNTGFAQGNNIGIKKALLDPNIEYIVLLNNDTIVEKDWLFALIKKVNYKKRIDMVASLALFPNGQVQCAGLRFEKDLLGGKVGGLSRGYGEDPTAFRQTKEIFCPSGVSCLFTRRLLEDVDLFDEDYFAYAEDIDLGIRARQKGYRCIFTPHSRLVHLHSQTAGGEASPFKAYLIKRNIYFTAIKNFNLIDLLLFPIREIKWNIKNFFAQKKSTKKLKSRIGIFGIIKIMLRVYGSVLANFPKMLVKRFRKQKY